MSNTFNKVRDEVKRAYRPGNSVYMYRSDEFVTRKEAYAIMKWALPRGYNEFKAELILEHFSDDTLFQLAREGSVCMYVKGNDIPSKRDLQADEYDAQTDNTIRIWWD